MCAYIRSRELGHCLKLHFLVPNYTPCLVPSPGISKALLQTHCLTLTGVLYHFEKGRHRPLKWYQYYFCRNILSIIRTTFLIWSLFWASFLRGKIDTGILKFIKKHENSSQYQKFWHKKIVNCLKYCFHSKKEFLVHRKIFSKIF